MMLLLSLVIMLISLVIITDIHIRCLTFFQFVKGLGVIFTRVCHTWRMLDIWCAVTMMKQLVTASWPCLYQCKWCVILFWWLVIMNIQVILTCICSKLVTSLIRLTWTFYQWFFEVIERSLIRLMRVGWRRRVPVGKKHRLLKGSVSGGIIRIRRRNGLFRGMIVAHVIIDILI